MDDLLEVRVSIYNIVTNEIPSFSLGLYDKLVNFMIIQAGVLSIENLVIEVYHVLQSFFYSNIMHHYY